jgi:hypothetical protein
MKKVSRSILYKEKESIHFFLGEGQTLERDFNKKLWERPFWRELKNESEDTLRLFNNACYICTRVFYDDYSPNELKEYEKIAIDDHDDTVWINHMVPVTMALVVNWLSSEECQKLTEKRGRREDIKELCRRICVSIEESIVLPLEGKEDFQTLIIKEQQLPSGFINDESFQRNSFSKAMEDPSLKLIDIFNSIEFYIEVIKNNPSEWTSVVDQDSYFLKELPNLSASRCESKLRELWETLNQKFKDDTAQPQVREKAFNGQTSARTYHLASGMKGHMAKLIAAMYDYGMFLKEDNTPASSVEDVARSLGAAFGENFNNWRQTLGTAIEQQNYLDIFDDLQQKIKERKQKKQ